MYYFSWFCELNWQFFCCVFWIHSCGSEATDPVGCPSPSPTVIVTALLDSCNSSFVPSGLWVGLAPRVTPQWCQTLKHHPVHRHCITPSTSLWTTLSLESQVAIWICNMFPPRILNDTLLNVLGDKIFKQKIRRQNYIKSHITILVARSLKEGIFLQKQRKEFLLWLSSDEPD